MTAEEFKKARFALGMKQTELAMALETPYRTVQDWETGRNRIPGVAAVALRLLLERDRWATDQTLAETLEQFRRDIKGRLAEKKIRPKEPAGDKGKSRTPKPK